jgi:hypothetical protein
MEGHVFYEIGPEFASLYSPSDTSSDAGVSEAASDISSEEYGDSDADEPGVHGDEGGE